MIITVVDNGSSYLSNLLELCGPQARVVTRTEAVGVLPTIRRGDGCVVLSGGHGDPVAVNPDAYDVELQFLKTSTVPTIGICLGFELMVFAHGGRLELMKHRERGLLEISSLTQDSIFQNGQKFRVFENHRWVATALGPELIGLAKSKDGCEIVRHRVRPQYGFQFHPEMFESLTAGRSLFQAAMRKIFDTKTPR